MVLLQEVYNSFGNSAAVKDQKKLTQVELFPFYVQFKKYVVGHTKVSEVYWEHVARVPSQEVRPWLQTRCSRAIEHSSVCDATNKMILLKLLARLEDTDKTSYFLFALKYSRRGKTGCRKHFAALFYCRLKWNDISQFPQQCSELWKGSLIFNWNHGFWLRVWQHRWHLWSGKNTWSEKEGKLKLSVPWTIRHSVQRDKVFIGHAYIISAWPAECSLNLNDVSVDLCIKPNVKLSSWTYPTARLPAIFPGEIQLGTVNSQ